MENMFLLHTESSAINFSFWNAVLQDDVARTITKKNTKNTTQPPKAKWAKLAKILAHLSILG